ncbi:MAG: hypothetical protein RIQ71_751, partial [Verrucomicrobiota bacterium]
MARRPLSRKKSKILLLGRCRSEASGDALFEFSRFSPDLVESGHLRRRARCRGSVRATRADEHDGGQQNCSRDKDTARRRLHHDFRRNRAHQLRVVRRKSLHPARPLRRNCRSRGCRTHCFRHCNADTNFDTHTHPRHTANRRADSLARLFCGRNATCSRILNNSSRTR